MGNSLIEWTNKSWNPIRARNVQNGRIGHWCVKIDPLCANCYAAREQPRFQGPGAPRYAAQDAGLVKLFLDPVKVDEPIRWQKPQRVFVCSMTDLFLPEHPKAWIDEIFDTIAFARRHVFQVLTKRVDRMHQYLLAHADPLHYPNLWVGLSIGTQRAADAHRALAQDLASKGYRTWVSYEPAIEPVDWTGWEFLAGMVCGGESGPNARPTHPDWARETRDFCARAGIPYDFKQWGEWAPRDDLSTFDKIRTEDHPWLMAEGTETGMVRLGKRLSGRLLDGVTHDGFTRACAPEGRP